MKATIFLNNSLVIQAETELEGYALRKWSDANSSSLVTAGTKITLNFDPNLAESYFDTKKASEKEKSQRVAQLQDAMVQKEIEKTMAETAAIAHNMIRDKNTSTSDEKGAEPCGKRKPIVGHPGLDRLLYEMIDFFEQCHPTASPNEVKSNTDTDSNTDPKTGNKSA
jgi:hypothetical protein